MFIFFICSVQRGQNTMILSCRGEFLFLQIEDYLVVLKFFSARMIKLSGNDCQTIHLSRLKVFVYILMLVYLFFVAKSEHNGR